jgi:hypothetical protein
VRHLRRHPTRNRRPACNRPPTHSDGRPIVAARPRHFCINYVISPHLRSQTQNASRDLLEKSLALTLLGIMSLFPCFEGPSLQSCCFWLRRRSRRPSKPATLPPSSDPRPPLRSRCRPRGRLKKTATPSRLGPRHCGARAGLCSPFLRQHQRGPRRPHSRARQFCWQRLRNQRLSTLLLPEIRFESRRPSRSSRSTSHSAYAVMASPTCARADPETDHGACGNCRTTGEVAARADA